MFPINVCGTLYPYPDVGEDPWGIEHIQWAIAVSQCVSANNTAIQNIIAGGTFSNPMINDGDIIYQNLGLPDRLGIGFDGQVLTSQGGVPVWENPAPTPPPAPNYVLSDTSGNFSTGSATPVDVTNLNANLTTSGNPVEIKLVSDDTLTVGSYIGIRNVSAVNDTTGGFVTILRDSVAISIIPLYLSVVSSTSLWYYVPPSSVSFIDTVPAGTYNYKIQININDTIDADQNMQMFYCKLFLREI